MTPWELNGISEAEYRRRQQMMFPDGEPKPLPRFVTLTQEEVKMAHAHGITPKEAALTKRADAEITQLNAEIKRLRAQLAKAECLIRSLVRRTAEEENQLQSEIAQLRALI